MKQIRTQPRRTSEKSSGFTLVELLVVIVIIAILAAISILAFNGVQNRARTASLQTDLEGAYKQLMIDYSSNYTYPAGSPLATNGSPQTANGGNGLKSSPNNSYVYAVNTSITPQTFCLTETNSISNVSYYVSNTVNTPTLGVCNGIINIDTNPSFETDLSRTGTYTGGGTPAATLSLQTGGAYAGSKFARVTWGATATYSGGIYYGGTGETITAGAVYTFSGYVRTSKTQIISEQVEWHNSSGTVSTTYGTPVTVTAGTWTRVFTTGTVASGATYAVVGFYADSTASSPTWVSGDYLDLDAVMETAGSTLTSYADGNSPAWQWSGTTNLSTSTGPAT